MAVQLGAERATQPANLQPRHFTISNATNSWSVPFHRWYRAMRQATHGGRGAADRGYCELTRGGQWTAMQVAAILHRVGSAASGKSIKQPTNNKQQTRYSKALIPSRQRQKGGRGGACHRLEPLPGLRICPRLQRCVFLTLEILGSRGGSVTVQTDL